MWLFSKSLSVCLSVYLRINVTFSTCLCLSVYVYVSLPTYQCAISMSIFVCLSVCKCLFTILLVCLFTSVCLSATFSFLSACLAASLLVRLPLSVSSKTLKLLLRNSKAKFPWISCLFLATNFALETCHFKSTSCSWSLIKRSWLYEGFH